MTEEDSMKQLMKSFSLTGDGLGAVSMTGQKIEIVNEEFFHLWGLGWVIYFNFMGSFG